VSNNLSNKPVTPTREMLEILEEWAAPDVSASKKAAVVGKTNFLGVPIAELYKAKPQLIEPEEEEVPQLTAAEIDEIRQQAYEEGFTEGKQAGFDKGHEEGLEQGKQEGLELGHKDGFEAGQQEGQEDIQQQIARWESLLTQLYDPITRVEKATEQQLLNLSVMLAESVLRTEIKGNKESLLAALLESVAALPFNTEFAEIHMHPDDLLLVQEQYSESDLAEQKWILKPEAHFNLGDVIVATPNSLIDRTVEQRIKQTLHDFIIDANLTTETNSGPAIGDLPETVTPETATPETTDNLAPTENPEQAATAESDPANASSDVIGNTTSNDEPS